MEASGDSGLLENWLNSLQLNMINNPMSWAWDMAGALVTFLAETRYLPTQGRKVLFWPMGWVYSPSWKGKYGSESNSSCGRRSVKMLVKLCPQPPSTRDAGAQLTIFLLFTPTSQPLGWYYPHRWWVFSPQLNVSGNTFTVCPEVHLPGDFKPGQTDNWRFTTAAHSCNRRKWCKCCNSESQHKAVYR